MSETRLVELGKIQPNPEQTRRVTVDAEKLAELAADIEAHGLIETPTARRAGDGYELVVGHRRLAAYQQLAQKDAARWGKIPLRVMEVGRDQEMFELNVAENMKRADLDPIEQAQAMQRYMEKFKATSEQAGKLFGLQASTVRGKVRLLELPKEVRAQVAGGEIPEIKARSLLVLQKVATKQAVVKAAEKGLKNGNLDDAIDDELERSKEAVALAEADDDVVMRNGWPLSMDAKNFPLKFLPPLAEKSGEGAENDQAEHLRKPPACTACPFHALTSQAHYCGLKVCFDRKAKAWGTHLLESATKSGITPYDENRDGKPQKMEKYNDRDDLLFRNKHAGVRLSVDLEDWHDWPGLPDGVVPVFVGAKPAVKRDASPWSRGPSAYERKQRLRSSRKGQVKKFIREVAAPHFAAALAKMPLPVLQDYAGWAKPYDLPNEGGAREFSSDRKKLQTQVAFYSLWRNFQETALDGDQYWKNTAKQLTAQAKHWGIKLPGAVQAAADKEQAAFLQQQKAKATKKAAGKKAKKPKVVPNQLSDKDKQVLRSLGEAEEKRAKKVKKKAKKKGK